MRVFKESHFIPEGSYAHVAYGFYGRKGGVSSGLYKGLNCGVGSGDDQGHVQENRMRVAGDLVDGANHVCGVYQVHGNQCVRLESPWSTTEMPHADALVTDQLDVPIGILTADCTPVLFCAISEANRVIGAAHAGWKGALSGVLGATVEALCSYDGIDLHHIRACIGPAIAQASYEVGDDLKDQVIKDDAQNQRFFAYNEETRSDYFDLQGFCRSQLERAGITQISQIAMDTYANEDTFFSYRRATHHGEKDYGRQISAIALRSATII